MSKRINLEEVIESKKPGALKWIPKFLLRYVKRVIHLDQLNYILDTYGECDGIGFSDGSLETMKVNYKILQKGNLPPADGKRYIFASNHPLGGLDGLVLISALGPHYNKQIRFIVNDLLLSVGPLQEIFVPVNKLGRQSAEYAKTTEGVYQSENQILTFPAGLCSRKIKGKITDVEWRKSFIAKAVQYERDVVPIYFEGRNSNFFYNLANLRKKLGVKANIEMVYLPDEMFKQEGNTFNLIIGKPIPYTTFDKSKTPVKWAQWVKEQVYALPAQYMNK